MSRELHPHQGRIEDASAVIMNLTGEIQRAVIGQQELIRGVIIGLLCQGNLLLEGQPGLGKTLLVKVLAEAVQLRFSRIQFTPDLMPADITGTQALVDDGQDGVEFGAHLYQESLFGPTGNDLNGDGDTADLVVRWFRLP